MHVYLVWWESICILFIPSKYHPSVPTLYPNFTNGKLLNENEAGDNKSREWLVLILSHIRALMHAPCPSSVCPFSPLFAPLLLNTIFLGQVNGCCRAFWLYGEHPSGRKGKRRKKKEKKNVKSTLSIFTSCLGWLTLPCSGYMLTSSSVEEMHTQPEADIALPLGGPLSRPSSRPRPLWTISDEGKKGE